jgi:hypothetical protein
MSNFYAAGDDVNAMSFGEVASIEREAVMWPWKNGYVVDTGWGPFKEFCCFQAAYDYLIDEGFTLVD